MPAEIRYIVFSRDEATAAVEAYGRGTFPRFPSGPVLGIETIGDEAPSARVLIRERPTEFAQVDIPAQELLACMIRACRDARVPLPSRAPKRLCLVNGSLALAITLDGRRSRPWPASSSRRDARRAVDMTV